MKRAFRFIPHAKTAISHDGLAVSSTHIPSPSPSCQMVVLDQNLESYYANDYICDLIKNRAKSSDGLQVRVQVVRLPFREEVCLLRSGGLI